MGKLLEGMGKWVGYMGSAIALVGYLAGLFSDPLYIGLALVIIALAAWGFAFQILLTKVEAVSPILTGEPAPKKSVHAYGLWIRRASFAGAVAMTFVAGFYAWFNFDGIFALAAAYNPVWVGNGHSGVEITVGNNQPLRQDYDYRLVSIMDANDDPCVIDGACALRFDLWKRDLVQWVRVNDVRVVVHSYKPGPPHVGRKAVYGGTGGTPTEPYIYLVEIENREGTYSAVNRYERVEDGKSKKRDTLAVVSLEKERPDPILVRVNAKEEGIYIISCDVVVGHKDRVNTVHAGEPAEFLFTRSLPQKKGK